jgi:excisionase family DNA binding protein
MEAQNFTVAEAAEYLNISTTVLYELIKAKPCVIPTNGVFGKTMITRNDLDDYIDFLYMDGGYGVSDD